MAISVFSPDIAVDSYVDYTEGNSLHYEIGPGLGDQLLCQKPDDAAHNYCERIYYNAYHKVIYLKLLGFGIIVGFGSGFCFNPCNFVLVNIDFCHKLLKS